MKDILAKLAALEAGTTQEPVTTDSKQNLNENVQVDELNASTVRSYMIKATDGEDDRSWQNQPKIGGKGDRRLAGINRAGDRLAGNSVPKKDKLQINADVNENEDDDIADTCADCNGSGEGQFDGTRCRTCGGSGVENSKQDTLFDKYDGYKDRDDRADDMFGEGIKLPFAKDKNDMSKHIVHRGPSGHYTSRKDIHKGRQYEPIDDLTAQDYIKKGAEDRTARMNEEEVTEGNGLDFTDAQPGDRFVLSNHPKNGDFVGNLEVLAVRDVTPDARRQEGNIKIRMTNHPDGMEDHVGWYGSDELNGSIGTKVTSEPQVNETESAARFGVYLKGGDLASAGGKPKANFATKEEAIAFAKRRNAQLTPGEKGYYGMKYFVRPMKQDTVEEEQVNELSPETLKSYVKKAVDPRSEKSISNLASRSGYEHAKNGAEDFSAGEKDDKKAYQRSKGVARAVDRLTDDVNNALDFLQTDTSWIWWKGKQILVNCKAVDENNVEISYKGKSKVIPLEKFKDIVVEEHLNNIDATGEVGLGETVVAEKSTSEKQARFMAAAAHNPKFAKKTGMDQSVAKEFNKADTGTKQLSNAMKHKPTTEAVATDKQHKDAMDKMFNDPNTMQTMKNLKRRDQDPEFDREQKDKFVSSLKTKKTNEEQVNELSPKTLGSYVKSASKDAKSRGYDAGAADWSGDEMQKHPDSRTWPGREQDAKAHKRLKGIDRAVNKLTTENKNMKKHKIVTEGQSFSVSDPQLARVLRHFPKEITDFNMGGDLDDDLYNALYDHYFDEMPYGTKKARTGDPYEWVSQRLSAELSNSNLKNKEDSFAEGAAGDIMPMESESEHFACTYCGKEVPPGVEPTMFNCCGEVGHVDPIDDLEEALSPEQMRAAQMRSQQRMAGVDPLAKQAPANPFANDQKIDRGGDVAYNQQASHAGYADPRQRLNNSIEEDGVNEAFLVEENEELITDVLEDMGLDHGLDFFFDNGLVAIGRSTAKVIISALKNDPRVHGTPSISNIDGEEVQITFDKQSSAPSRDLSVDDIPAADFNPDDAIPQPMRGESVDVDLEEELTPAQKQRMSTMNRDPFQTGESQLELDKKYNAARMAGNAQEAARIKQQMAQLAGVRNAVQTSSKVNKGEAISELAMPTKASLQAEIKKLNDKMDAIVKDGGRIAQNDPLLVRQRNMKKKLASLNESQKTFDTYAQADKHFTAIAHETGESAIDKYAGGDAGRYSAFVKKHVKDKVNEEVTMKIRATGDDDIVNLIRKLSGISGDTASAGPQSAQSAMPDMASMTSQLDAINQEPEQEEPEEMHEDMQHFYPAFLNGYWYVSGADGRKMEEYGRFHSEDECQDECDYLTNPGEVEESTYANEPEEEMLPGYGTASGDKDRQGRRQPMTQPGNNPMAESRDLFAQYEEMLKGIKK